MKLILSRKGFDSGYGGFPSPILPDRRMISLPIPHSIGPAFRDVRVSETQMLGDIMSQLCPNPKLGGKSITLDSACHLDPDLNRNSISRDNGWRPVFGQNNAAQGHLARMGVGVGDVFLFFGWFRHTELDPDGTLQYAGDPQGFHSIFGYLEIGSIHAPGQNLFADKIPGFAATHPHMHQSFIETPNNVIYIASDNFIRNRNRPGAANLLWNPGLRLSQRGRNRTVWDLPYDIFSDVSISYHDKTCWKDGLFHSRPRGQEFVVSADKKVRKWLTDLIISADFF